MSIRCGRTRVIWVYQFNHVGVVAADNVCCINVAAVICGVVMQHHTNNVDVDAVVAADDKGGVVVDVCSDSCNNDDDPNVNLLLLWCLV